MDALVRDKRLLRIGRDGLGNKNLVLPEAIARGSTGPLSHFRDPRDGLEYLASIVTAAVQRPPYTRPVGMRAFESPLIVAATDRRELERYQLSVIIICTLLWVVDLGLFYVAMRALAQRDNQQLEHARGMFP